MNNENQSNMLGFLVIFSGQAVSLLGSSIVRFALIWWLTINEGSAQVLATASLMAYLPDLVIGPFSGVIVDRMDRKRIMILADAFVALTTVLLIVRYLSGDFGIGMVYTLLLVRSVGTAFHWPAMESSVSLMVPDDQLQRVSGIQEGVNGLVSIIGPPFSAFLVALFPLEYVMAIDVVTAIVAIIPLLVTRIPRPARESGEVTISSILGDLKEGFVLLSRWVSLLSFAFMIMLVHVVVIPAISFMPLVVTSLLGGGSKEFALIESVFGVGIIVGGVFLSAWGGFEKKTYTIACSIVVCGIGFLTLWSGLGGSLIVSYAGTFVYALSVSIVAASIGALRKAVVPVEYQGRIFTLIRSATNAMPALGLAIAGPISEVIGLRTWYLVGGVVFILVGLGSWVNESTRNIESDGVPDLG